MLHLGKLLSTPGICHSAITMVGCSKCRVIFFARDGERANVTSMELVSPFASARLIFHRESHFVPEHSSLNRYFLSAPPT